MYNKEKAGGIGSRGFGVQTSNTESLVKNGGAVIESQPAKVPVPPLHSTFH